MLCIYLLAQSRSPSWRVALMNMGSCLFPFTDPTLAVSQAAEDQSWEVAGPGPAGQHSLCGEGRRVRMTVVVAEAKG